MEQSDLFAKRAITWSNEVGQDARLPEKQHDVQPDFREVLRRQQGMLLTVCRVAGRFIHTLAEGELLCRLGLDSDQVIGKEVADFLPKQLAKEMERYYEQVWRGNEVVFDADTGSGIQFRAALKPIRAKSGRVTQVVVSCVEITEWKTAEQQLKRREQRYRSLFEHNLHLVCSLDLRGGIVSANQAFYRITGLRPNEIKHLRLATMIPAEDVYKAVRMFVLAKRGVRQCGEFAIRHKYGWRVELNAMYVPIFLDKKIDGVYIIARDVTEQKRKEDELRTVKEELESLFQHTADPIGVLDRQGRIIRINRAAERTFGFLSTETAGMQLPIEPGSEASQLLAKVLDGQTITGYEKTLLQRDGDRLELSLTLSPIHNADGDVVAISCIGRDITERKRMEENLQESERQLRSLINAMPDFVCLKDAEGRWLEANEYAVQLFQLGELGYKGKKDSEIAQIYPMYKETLYQCMQSDEQAWAAGGTLRVEETVKLPDGVVRTFDLIKVPIFIHNGKRKAMVIIGRDITERKKTEELLRMSDKLSAVGELAAGVAHEIRNPLTALKGFIQLLQASDNGNNYYYEIMLSELERINSIVGELLLLAKPQVVSFVKRDLISLLGNVISLLGTQAIMRKVEIRTSFEMEHLSISCVENQLKQVFINLLKNAVEAMPPCGGVITIRVMRQEPDHVIIRIIDQGCGIPEESLSRLGEPFFTTKEKGTGLGLMVSYKIIQNHRGTITFSSQVGKGTTVDIALPLS